MPNTVRVWPKNVSRPDLQNAKYKNTSAYGDWSGFLGVETRKRKGLGTINDCNHIKSLTFSP
jgi:hypothetical protein